MRTRSVHPTLIGLTLAYVLAGVVLVVAAVPDPGATAGAVLAVLVSGVGLVLAWLIAVRTIDNPVATALAVIGALAVVVPVVEDWGASAGTSEPWPASDFAAPLVQAVWPFQLVGFGLLLLTFPAAPLRRPFARRALCGGGAAVALILVGNWGTRAGDAFTGWRVPVTVSGLVLLALTLLACTVDLVRRARRAGPIERRQIRWLQLASGCVLVLMVVSWLTVPDLVPADVGYTSFLVALYLLVPSAVAIAVIRHDLFDIDRLLSESAAVLVTSVVAATMWAASVVLVHGVVQDAAGLETGAAAFATALVLVPTYRWAHRWSAATFDRHRTRMLAQVRAFATDVHEGLRQPEEVGEVLSDVLGDPGLRVGLVVPGSSGLVDPDGESVELRQDVVLRAGSVTIGAVELGRSSARQRRLAHEAVEHVWSAFESARLRAGLRAAVNEVEASRERLSTAASAERRRLERDLHDGAQQALVAIGMRLRSAQRDLQAGSDQHADIETAIGQLGDTVLELRRISQGVRPSRLDDGLGPALEALRESSPIPVIIRVDEAAGHDRLEETVAQTAYYLVSEAVTNALKHAYPSTITVDITRREQQIVITVCDDGVGGVDPLHGLTALRDRVASLNGTLAVTSPASGGTRIQAVL